MPTIAPEITPSPTPTNSPSPSPLPKVSTSQRDNWGYVVFCGVYPSIVFGIYSIIKRKSNNEDWKHLGNDQLLQGVLIGVGYEVF